MQYILDRNTPPLASPLNNIKLPTYQKSHLSNGIPVYTLTYGSAEVVQVQMVFKAGSSLQSKVGIATYMASHMQEGTQSYSSLQLAQKLDEFGAWIEHEVGESYLSLNLTTLSTHIAQTLPLLHEVVCAPSFPEHEFDQMKARNLQKLKVNAQKTSYQARRDFGHYMYGAAHPYGRHLGEEELASLSLESIKAYHHQYIYPENSFIIVVGQFDQAEMMKELNELFSSYTARSVTKETSRVLTASIKSQNGRRYKEMEGLQATIRLGHLGFRRSHPDYYPMQVVNTILGGYFGSRLMKNIREEKGYTYGIYSGWISYKYSGVFVVQGDIGNKYIEDTISEVKKEIHRLMEEPVPANELELVKNYLLGKNINQRETPFQLADLIRFSVVNDISFTEIDQKFDIIQGIKADEILALAQKHFKPTQLLEVVCGKRL